MTFGPEFFEKAFTGAGGKTIGKETYTSKDTDFSAILAKVAAAKPDIISLPDYYNIVNLVTKQAKEKGITAPFMGGDGWDSSDLDLKAADGGYFTNHYSPEDSRPAVKNLVKAFGAKFKDDKGQPKVPDALVALAYDATNLLLQSIKNAGANDPASFGWIFYLEELLRVILRQLGAEAPTWRFVLYPISLLLLMLVRPQGSLGRREWGFLRAPAVQPRAADEPQATPVTVGK